MNNVTFAGSYSKIIKKPGQLFNSENITKNNYLVSDFQGADMPLMHLAGKLGDKDTVTLLSEKGDLKLLVKSAGEKFSINLGIEEGLSQRLSEAYDKIIKKFNLK